MIDRAGGALGLYLPEGTPIEGASDLSPVAGANATVEVDFTDHWYNVLKVATRKVYDSLLYSNVAMPVGLDGETLRWVDLEIDVHCPDDGPIFVGHEEESRRNVVAMGYPDDLAEQGLEARDELIRL